MRTNYKNHRAVKGAGAGASSPTPVALSRVLLFFVAILAPATATADSLPALDSVRIEQLDSEIVRNQSELERTRLQLGQVQTQLEQLREKEDVGLAKMSSYEQQIGLTQRLISQLSAQATARSREIAAVAGQMQRTEERVTARRQDLGRRLVSIYKYGRTYPLEALLSTRSLPELYRKTVYLRSIARADRRLAVELTMLVRQQDEQRQRLVAAHADLQRLQDEQARQEAGLAAARATEQALLRVVQEQKGEREALAQQLADAANRLQALIADLERRRAEVRPESSDFARGRGKLPWPLRGRVIAAYGTQQHPRYKTRTTNLGIDIAATSGAVVRAVARGRVAYADEFMGYGNLVIVDHGAGFYTLYANLAEVSVSVGQSVAAGTSVGSPGEYLHFEVRKDGKPVDPMDWLAE